MRSVLIFALLLSVPLAAWPEDPSALPEAAKAESAKPEPVLPLRGACIVTACVAHPTEGRAVEVEAACPAGYVHSPTALRIEGGQVFVLCACCPAVVAPQR